MTVTEAMVRKAGEDRPVFRLRHFVGTAAAEFRRDLPLHLTIFAYLLVVLLASVVAGRTDRFQPFMYAISWMMALPIFLSIGGPVVLATRGVLRAPTAPLQGVADVLRRARLGRIAAALLLFTNITLFYGGFTSAKNLLPEFFSFSSDVSLANLDRALHFGIEPWSIGFEWLKMHTVQIDFVYANVWFVAMLLAVFYVAISNRLASERRRLLLVFLASWIVLGNLLAGLFLSGGPIFFDRIVGDAERFAALTDHLAAHQNPALSVQTYQLHLWGAYVSGRSEFGTGISAFPSMHLAMATWVAIVFARISRWLMPLGILLVAVVLVGSVHLGWHYAIDGYASIVFVLLAWWVTGKVASQRGTT